MTEEQNLRDKTPTETLYSVKAVLLATFLGGPLASGYFISRNFQEFNETREAKWTWIISVSVFLFLLVLNFIPVIDHIPSQIFPLTFTAAAYSLTKHYQGERIENHTTRDGLFHSWWKVLGISTLFMVITLSVFFSTIWLTFPSEQTKTYGPTQNEVTFFQGEISTREIDSIAAALEKTDFFTNEEKSFAFVEKKNRTYEISFSMLAPQNLDTETIETFSDLRNELQDYFPKHKIVIKLVDGDIEKVVKRLE